MTTENTITLVNSILGEIGTAANTLRGELIETAATADTCTGRRLHALETLAEKIGWLADMALEKTTGSPDIVGDAEDWFMPPSYLDARRAGETSGQDRTANKPESPQ